MFGDLPNKPQNSSDGILISIKMDNSYGAQLYFDSYEKIYYRYKVASSWKDWLKISFS